MNAREQPRTQVCDGYASSRARCRGINLPAGRPSRADACRCDTALNSSALRAIIRVANSKEELLMEASSPATLYATVVGAALTIAGIIGFFYSGSFGSPGDVDEVFGILSVNGWHNVVHLATGLLGLAAAGYAAREYALGLGLVYLLVATWGFIVGSGDSILGIVPVNTEDNLLHLILGLVGLAAGAASPAARPTGPAPV